MIAVLVVDDHPIVREGLKQILSAEADIRVVGEAEAPAAAIELGRTVPCDVVVLDLGLPGRGGLEALSALKLEHPKLPVLILSVHPADQFAVRLLRAGASGYLTKDAAPGELVKAIRKVVQGGMYITATFAEQLAIDLQTDGGHLSHETLSDREYLVMTMLVSGKSITEIADELSLSVKTISTYRTRVLEKMSLRNNAELIRYAIQHHLV